MTYCHCVACFLASCKQEPKPGPEHVRFGLKDGIALRSDAKRKRLPAADAWFYDNGWARLTGRAALHGLKTKGPPDRFRPVYWQDDEDRVSGWLCPHCQNEFLRAHYWEAADAA